MSEISVDIAGNTRCAYSGASKSLATPGDFNGPQRSFLVVAEGQTNMLQSDGFIGDTHVTKTIIEMIFFADAIDDGRYLNLQLPVSHSDAARCRPLSCRPLICALNP